MNAIGSIHSESRSGYASVNGLEMYYEIHGSGRPLVLLHGALSATGTSFGKLIPELARGRQVISFEQQGQGRTADVDRPLRLAQMAEDTVAALRSLGIENADFFGWSMGAGIALQVAIEHPEVVGRLIIASVTHSKDGFHPAVIEGVTAVNPEMLVGSPWQVEYTQIAPNPDGFADLVAKTTEMNLSLADWPAEAVRSIKAPTLIVIGDSDLVRPEHAVEIFRLRGGGVAGDFVGLPDSQLAILPGTTHVGVVDRADLLLPMIKAFLGKPNTEA
jgi:pimeloyl-ACP methyl ester carboxylesterase